MQIILIMALSLLILVSFFIIISNSIRRSVILNGVLSILTSFTFIMLFAPDAALAEAVIGSTISTIVLLIAIKHLRVIYVFNNLHDFPYEETQRIFDKVYNIEEYDVQFASNTEYISHNLSRYHHIDYFLAENETEVLFFSRRDGHDRNQILQALKEMTGKNVREITNLLEIEEEERHAK